MKYLKALGLAIAATVLVCAGSASAATLTSPPGTPYTGTFSMSAGGMIFDHSFVTASCGGSTITGKIEAHGTSVPASGKISLLTFTECNLPITVMANGTFSIHAASNGD